MNDVQNINPNQMKQIEEMKKVLLGKILNKEAHERLSRVRMVDPNLASQVDLHLLTAYQSGRLQNSVTDGELREILKVLHTKKQFKIKRK